MNSHLRGLVGVFVAGLKWRDDPLLALKKTLLFYVELSVVVMCVG